MTESIANVKNKKEAYLTPLQVITTLYGLLYLVFFVISFIPSPNGSPISDNPNFNPWDLEMIFVKLLFFVFLLGYFYSWRNEGIAGIIFLFWFVLMLCMAVWVTTSLHRDSDMAIVMALPVPVVATLFIRSWRNRRKPHSTLN